MSDTYDEHLRRRNLEIDREEAEERRHREQWEEALREFFMCFAEGRRLHGTPAFELSVYAYRRQLAADWPHFMHVHEVALDQLALAYRSENMPSLSRVHRRIQEAVYAQQRSAEGPLDDPGVGSTFNYFLDFFSEGRNIAGQARDNLVAAYEAGLTGWEPEEIVSVLHQAMVTIDSVTVPTVARLRAMLKERFPERMKEA